MKKKYSNLEIAILIPCFNEEQTISNVIENFKKQIPNCKIYVCDNNSSDKTSEISKRHGATVIKEFNQGKGNAVLRLFYEVNADLFVMVDGDDTYPSSSVGEMIDSLITYNLDMVIGDRISNGTYKSENKRKFHYFGNKLIKKLINNVFKSNLNDILSGYRVFSKRFIKNYATLAKGFELETDLSIFALHYDLNIKEIPISYKDRPLGSNSKLNTVHDGFKVIMTFFSLFMFYKPLSFFTKLSVLILILSIIAGSFPIYEFLKFQYVYKVPTAILAVSLAIISMLTFTCGLILEAIMKIDKKNTKLNIRNS